MRRRFLAVASAISLLLAVASAAGWAKSTGSAYSVTHFAPISDLSVSMTHGEIYFRYLNYGSDQGFKPEWRFSAEKHEQGDGELAHPLPGWWGLHYKYEGFFPDAGYQVEIFIPMWSLCTLFCVFPVLAMMIHTRRTHRLLNGKCSNCGYSLL
jgi:hypothetical protein